MGTEVLISSPECGTLSFDMASSGNVTYGIVSNKYNAWTTQRITSHANYAQRCYSINNLTARSCEPFIKRDLSTTVDRNASCPFRHRICRHASDNIKIDTGYLNSQAQFGLNAPVDSQYNLRIITHCAPLKAKGYKKTIFHSPDKPYVQYFYGPEIIRERSGASHGDFTFEMQQQSASDIEVEPDFLLSPDYRLE